MRVVRTTFYIYLAFIFVCSKNSFTQSWYIQK